MLKQNTPYVRVLKLVTGEEIIAKIVEDNDSELSLCKPLQMAMGQHGPQLANFMLMADPSKNIMIKKAAILATSQPVKELENQYESITSGIALPAKSGIIT